MNSKSVTMVVSVLLLLIVASVGILSQTNDGNGPYQATGIKIGEVDQTRAIIWTRLTLNAERVSSDAPLPKILYKDPESGKLRQLTKEERGTRDKTLDPVVIYPEGYNVNNIAGAVPGTTGKTCVFYKAKNSDGWKSTGWKEVDPDHDYTHQFRLKNLEPNTEYQIRVESESESGVKGQTIEGRFETAPTPDQPAKVVFTVVTGQGETDHDAGDMGWKIYPNMLALHPSFFVATGDNVYYDKLGKTKALARYHWSRTYSFPYLTDFYRQVGSYFEKDDHDTWVDDCYPKMKTKFMGKFTFKEGQQIFLDEVPMGDHTWRTVRWGKDLQIWLPEGRDFRSSNTMPDGPEKTIWGKKQKEWFKNTVRQSDASFRILIDQTPVVGPDRKNKGDNLANKAFKTEGDEIRQFLADRKNMIVICGDRHWQYVSRDIKTGLWEFSCGAETDEHAGGWKQGNYMPEHEYLNVVGGFLGVTIERVNNIPFMILKFYDIDGKVLHRDNFMRTKYGLFKIADEYLAKIKRQG